MNSALKTTSLDFSLLKPYMKAICFVLLVPVVFILASPSLASGVSFAMCMMSMSSSYTFAVSEKNGMDRLYGILPVRKKDLVLGKYICLCGMGLLGLLVSLILQPLVLLALSVAVNMTEILYLGLMGALMFVFNIAFQVPGYYKYGSIKGRIFMYIPVVGFLFATFLFNSTNNALSRVLETFSKNPIIALILIILLITLMLFISVIVSIKILKNKEF